MSDVEVNQGQTIRYRVRFYQRGRAIDPSSVAFAYKVGQNPSSAPVYYGNSPEPGIGIIGRNAVGDYECWVSTANISGICTGKWTATGNGASTAWIDVKIVPAPF